jgi:hypothetical protein
MAGVVRTFQPMEKASGIPDILLYWRDQNPFSGEAAFIAQSNQKLENHFFPVHILI